MEDDDEFFDALDRLDVRVLNQAVENRLARTANVSSDDRASNMGSSISSSMNPSSPPPIHAPPAPQAAFYTSVPPQPSSSTPLPSMKSAAAVQPSRRGKRSREDLPSHRNPGGGVELEEGSSSTITSSSPNSTSSPLLHSWVCSRCTLINEAAASHCAACEAKRTSLAHSSLGVGEQSSRGATSSGSAAIEPLMSLQCPRCTFMNANGAFACAICECRLPEASNTAIDVANSTSVPLFSHRSPVSSINSGTSTLVNTLNEASGASPTTIPEDGMNHSESEEDWDSSEDSASTYISSDDDSSEEEEVEDEMEEQESSDQLVEFLQNLDAYPATDLPLADVPLSMVENGHLKPFQRQGLYWLLYREKRVPPPSQGRDPVEGTDRANTSFSSSTTRREPRGIAGDAETQRNKYVESKVRGGIFADFMGLGKTRTLISLCECTRERHRLSNVSGSEVVSHATLIVAPTSLISQWVSEIKKCVRPVPRVLHYTSRHRRKLSFFQIAENYDYVLVSYQSLRAEAFPPRNEREKQAEQVTGSSFFRRDLTPRNQNGIGSTSDENRPTGHLFMIKWNRIILDEAHYIRNSRSKQSRSCFLLTGTSRWAVTATPVQNSVNDVFPLVKFLQVPFFSNVKWWNQEIIQYFRRDLQHPRPTTALRMMFSSLSLRRTPATLINGKPLLDLPPISNTCVPVELSPVVREFYNSVFTQANEKLQQINNANHSPYGQRNQYRVFQTAFEMLIRCRQACLHPYLVVAALLRCRDIANGKGTPLNTVEKNEIKAASKKRSSLDAETREMNEQIQRFIDTHLIRMIKRTQKDQNRRLGTDTDLCGSEFVKDLIEALKSQKLRERECLICLEKMESPGILPCGHSFCFECAIHALEHAQRCPTCKHPTSSKMVLQVPQDLLGSTSADVEKGENGSQLTSQRPVTMRETQIYLLGSQTDLSLYSNWPATFSNKTEALVHHLNMIPSGEKCVVFSSFATYLHYLKDYLDRETTISSELFTGSLTVPQKNKVLQKFRNDGSERGNGRTVRNEVNAVEEEFSSSTPPTVLLATITSCGVGINLECANHVFLMDPNYNPGLEIQAIHRVHRMGQLKPVSITKFIAANTIEENIENLRKVKASMSSYCFEAVHSTSSSSGASHRLTTQELLTLFSAPGVHGDREDEE